jgi:hypothetical protein
VAGDFIELRGADGFLKLSKALKQAGETKMRTRLHKGMRDVVTRHKPKVDEALAAVLPSGLQDRAKVRQVIRVKTGGDPGVSVGIPFGKRTRGGLGATNARMLNNQGMIRHPTFGQEPWVNQVIGGAGFFDNTWRSVAPAARRELELEIQAVLDEIVREAG